jgi:CDP-paratose 2-epimerase
VTGGAGFIGSHVAEYFAANDHDVVLLDNLSRKEMLGGVTGNYEYNWQYLRNKYSNIRLFNKDIRDSQAVRDAASGGDVIIHTAGQVAVTTSLQDPRTDFEINVLGTFNILEAARQSDATVIFCSTNKVYGENVNVIPVKEADRRYHFADPNFKEGVAENLPVDRTAHTPYGSSKLAADIYVQDYAHSYDIKTGVFRLSCIYGERQWGCEEQGWVAWFTIATLTNRPITIYGNGKQVRDVLYVKDLVDAYDCFLHSKIKSGIFNLGGGSKNTLSLLELCDLLRTTTGKKPNTRFAEWRPADQRVYISDITKARETLGWKPTVTPKDGVTRLVQWISQHIGEFT